jgi:hypothetical protein
MQCCSLLLSYLSFDHKLRSLLRISFFLPDVFATSHPAYKTSSDLLPPPEAFPSSDDFKIAELRLRIKSVEGLPAQWKVGERIEIFSYGVCSAQSFLYTEGDV